jgi:hypothetical protein
MVAGEDPGEEEGNRHQGAVDGKTEGKEAGMDVEVDLMARETLAEDGSLLVRTAEVVSRRWQANAEIVMEKMTSFRPTPASREAGGVVEGGLRRLMLAEEAEGLKGSTSDSAWTIQVNGRTTQDTTTSLMAPNTTKTTTTNLFGTAASVVAEADVVEAEDHEDLAGEAVALTRRWKPKDKKAPPLRWVKEEKPRMKVQQLIPLLLSQRHMEAADTEEGDAEEDEAEDVDFIAHRLLV